MDKNIIYIISAIVIIILIIIIYNFTKSKQNFEKIKHRKPINIITFSREKLKKALIESANKTIKQWEKNKIASEKLFSIQRIYQNQLKALDQNPTDEGRFAIDGVDYTNAEVKQYDPSNILSDTLLLKRLSECTLGRIYNLPEKNLENSAEFSKRDRRSIFKEMNEVGDIYEGSRQMASTIGPEALKNGFISATKDTALIDGKFVFCSNTRKFTESISDKTTGSLGASYAAVTVKATASYLTESSFKSDMHIQSYNISVRKFSQSITLSPDNFKLEFLHPDMLKDLSDLGDPSLSVKDEMDPDKIGQARVILTGSESPDEMMTKVPNTYINGTNWLKCKEFFSKWGSHFVTSIDYGKKLNLWETMTTSKEESTNLMERKACLQLSYGGYTECTTKCSQRSIKQQRDLGKQRDQATTTPDPLSLKDVDFDAPVDWNPAPVPGSENLPTTTTPIGGTTTTPAGGGTGGGTTTTPFGQTTTPYTGGTCDSCGTGKVCSGYTPESEGRSEMMGSCVPKDPPAPTPPGVTVPPPTISVGGTVCNARSESSSETLESASTTTKVILQGGDEKISAKIMGKKLAVGNSPGIDQQSMIEFLEGTNADVPIKYTFKSIWSLLIELYGDKCATFLENTGKYKVKGLRNGLKMNDDGTFSKSTTPSCIAYIGKAATDYFMSAGLNSFLNGPGNSIKNPNYPVRVIVQADEKTLALLDNDEWGYNLVNPYVDTISVESDPIYCTGRARLPSKFYYCSIVQSVLYVDSDFVPVTDYKYTGQGKTTPPPGQLTQLFNIFYVNDETKENIFELYVPSYELFPVVDPCRILQAAYNLEAAYISDIVCPYVTTGAYGIIQKMIPLNPLNQDPNGNYLKKYGCWNKVTGCQNDRDCIGAEIDAESCTGFWTSQCKDVWSSCQQGGLWHESIMDSSINGPNSTAKEGQYRTLAVRPANVPLKYAGGPSDSSSYDETTDMRKFAQVSCMSSNTRFFPDGSTTNSKRAPLWQQYKFDTNKCFCQNRYIPDCKTQQEVDYAISSRDNNSLPPAKCLINNTWELDKYKGAVVLPDSKSISDNTGPNILPNRLIWNQCMNVT